MPTKIKQSQNLQKHGIYSFNQPFQATPLVFTCWSLCPKSWNKIMHTLSGNRILGYRIGLWNCRKGLLLSDNNPSEKLTDIESLLQKHDLHLLGVVESDLHGAGSRVRKTNHIEKFVIRGSALFEADEAPSIYKN